MISLAKGSSPFNDAFLGTLSAPPSSKGFVAATVPGLRSPRKIRGAARNITKSYQSHQLHAEWKNVRIKSIRAIATAPLSVVILPRPWS